MNWRALFGTLVLFLTYSLPTIAQTRIGPWDVLRSDVVEPPDGFVSIANATLGSDGSLYVADFSRGEVRRFAPDGHPVWVFGLATKPGEERFRPYRLSAVGDSIVVYDLARNAIIFLDKDGREASRHTLALSFTHVDAVIVIGDALAISGTVLPTLITPPTADQFGVHVFTLDGKYLRSFGPLPIARNRSVLNQWGAGVISRSLDGKNLFYVRKLPYEIYEYTPVGRLVRVVKMRRDTASDPTDYFTAAPAEARGGVEIRVSDIDVPVPGRAVALPCGALLASRGFKKRTLQDHVSSADVIESTVLPPGWGPVFAVDTVRLVAWRTESYNGRPVVLRQQLRASLP